MAYQVPTTPCISLSLFPPSLPSITTTTTITSHHITSHTHTFHPATPYTTLVPKSNDMYTQYPTHPPTQKRVVLCRTYTYTYPTITFHCRLSIGKALIGLGKTTPGWIRGVMRHIWEWGGGHGRWGLGFRDVGCWAGFVVLFVNVMREMGVFKREF